MATYKITIKSKQNFNAGGSKEKQGQQRTRTVSSPDQLPVLCRYQEACKAARYTLKHLHPDFLQHLARKPYRLCWGYFSYYVCQKNGCWYIHWNPDDDNEEVAGMALTHAILKHCRLYI